MDRVEIPRTEFIQGLKSLRVALTGKNPPDAILWVEDGFLSLKVGGSQVKVAAKGTLVGQARIKGKAIEFLRKAMPEGDPLVVQKKDGKVGISNLSLTCTWEDPIPTTITIPINASLVHILGLWQRYTNEEIEKSGFVPNFAAADQERIKRIKQSVELLRPMGVTEEDVTLLVDEAIKRANASNFED